METCSVVAQANTPLKDDGSIRDERTLVRRSPQAASLEAIADQAIELTTKEFALLDYFMRNPDRVLTRTMIAEHVWDYDFDAMTNVIDVYVNYLRNKIETGHEPKLIHTVRGVGYVLRED